ncbi:multiple resistance and pH regulation protein F [Isoalcanivorax pacificus W11-5]|jgi:multicomponent Na+:H+ antiporter subunit F|uniref:Multiple resistance and pH regulation protein F n=1 Tax=Isoalcanivorax pacificus W11-5 TaxID=391936 RepID=A0A0B4XMR4_9GAMM|nr:cation:proton antiporter [Isoalcanivorax pacificus]AJD47617.1 multiple resistance and pH regulation protein F [Isoalcanivorax pacificus W11-5]
MPAFVIWISYVMLSATLILAFIRLVRGPSLPDRVVALELMASLTVGFIGVYALTSDQTAFLDVAMVLALTAFLAAVGFARYLERGGHRDD